MAMKNPTFEPPSDGSDHEIWLLRAPAHLDVSALLDGATLDVDRQSLQSPPSTSNNILSRIKSDGKDYALAQGDANQLDNLRLLVPDKSSADGDDEYLIPGRPFHRQVHLTSVMGSSAATNSNGENTNIQSDLAVAPSKDAAPKPALDESGNGSVDAMRNAYVPIAQRQGLKRRWAMPGSNAKLPPDHYSMPKKKARVGEKEEQKKEKDTVVDDEKEASKSSSSKKDKKDKKKKEKKSKKSSKK